MITVTFLKRDGIVYGFKSVGHAYYDDVGKDIVCSSVSAVLFSVAETLEEEVEVRIKIDESKGMMAVKIKDDSYKNDRIQAILKVALKGIEGIKREYANYIEIKSKED